MLRKVRHRVCLKLLEKSCISISSIKNDFLQKLMKIAFHFSA